MYLKMFLLGIFLLAPFIYLLPPNSIANFVLVYGGGHMQFDRGFHPRFRYHDSNSIIHVVALIEKKKKMSFVSHTKYIE